MKTYLNEIKLKFREMLRVVGKGDLNKPNEYLVKRRKFKDIDITKDFEKRLNIKKKEDMYEMIANESIDITKMSLGELEEYRENIIKKEEEEKKSDLYKKVVLKDNK